MRRCDLNEIVSLTIHLPQRGSFQQELLPWIQTKITKITLKNITYIKRFAFANDYHFLIRVVLILLGLVVMGVCAEM